MRISNMGNEEAYVVPFPRGLYNHLEETFYWKCFDHFKAIEKRGDNSFSNWYGNIFEAYCFKLLKSIASSKFESLKNMESLQIPSPDACEILNDTAILFEFKARRLHRKFLQIYSQESEKHMFKVAKEFIDQLCRFANAFDQKQSHPLKKKLEGKSRIRRFPKLS